MAKLCVTVPMAVLPYSVQPYPRQLTLQGIWKNPF